MESEIKKEEATVYELIKQIRSEDLDPRLLTVEQRQECVEVLRLEGHQHAAIAEMLKWNIKTIKRDWDEIRARNAAKPTPELALRTIAELIMKASSKEDHLTRLARGKDGSVQERSQAEFYAWKVLNEAAQLLQSVGHLPSQSAKMVGDIYHHHENERQLSPEEMKVEIARIEKIIAEEGNDDPTITAKLDAIKKEIALIELSQQVRDLSNQVIDKPVNKKEQQNG